MTATHSLAAVFREAHQPLTIDEFPLPTLGHGEALVRVDCCTICGSDIHTVLGHRDVPRPTVLGHEIIGRIHDLPTVEPPTDFHGRQLQVGDRVVWSVAASCGQCDRCRAGIPQKCRSLFKYGHESTSAKNAAGGTHPLSGGLSQFCHLARGTTIVRVADELADLAASPASCATATVRQALDACGDLSGKHVLLFGAGMLGLTAAAMSQTLGATRVIVCDVNAQRLDRAVNFGATDTLVWDADAEQLKNKLAVLSGSGVEPSGVDAVLDFSGSPDAVELAPQMARVGGHVVLVGSVSKTRRVQWDPEQIVRRLLTITGVHNYTPPALAAAVEFLREHQHAFPFEQLVEASFSLGEINAAIDTAAQSGACRVAIRPWD